MLYYLFISLLRENVRLCILCLSCINCGSPCILRLMITLTTLDAVPLGQHESNIKPTEREDKSPNKLLIITITPGANIMVY